MKFCDKCKIVMADKQTVCTNGHRQGELTANDSGFLQRFGEMLGISFEDYKRSDKK